MKKLLLLFFTLVIFGISAFWNLVHANSNQKLSTFTDKLSQKILSNLVYDVVEIKSIKNNFRRIDIKWTSLSVDQVHFVRFYAKDKELLETYKWTIWELIEINLKQLKFKKNKKNSIQKNSIQHFWWERWTIRCIVDIPSTSFSLEWWPEWSEAKYIIADLSCIDLNALEVAKKTQTLIVDSLRNAWQTPKEDPADQHVFISQLKSIGDFVQFNYWFWEYGWFAWTAVKFGWRYIFLWEWFPIACSKLKDYTKVKWYSKVVEQGLCVN